MPSLKALEEFKSSYIQLGSEPDVMAELNLPLEVVRLPEHEPAALPDPVSDDSIDSSDFDLADTDAALGDDLAALGDDAAALGDDAAALGDDAAALSDDLAALSDGDAALADGNSEEIDFFGGLGDLLNGVDTHDVGPALDDGIDAAFADGDAALDDGDAALDDGDAALADGDAALADTGETFDLQQTDDIPALEDTESIEDDPGGFDLSDLNLEESFPEEPDLEYSSPDEGDLGLEDFDLEPADEAEFADSMSLEEQSGDQDSPLEFEDSSTEELSFDEDFADADAALADDPEAFADFDTGEDIAVTDDAFDFPSTDDIPEFEDQSLEQQTFTIDETTSDEPVIDETVDEFEGYDLGEEEIQPPEEFSDEPAETDADAAFADADAAFADGDAALADGDAALADADAALADTGASLASEDDDDFGFADDAKGYNTESFMEDISGDSFDSFSPDFGSTEFGLGDHFDELEELPIPGLDVQDLTSLTNDGIDLSDDGVEEINLSSEDLEQFLTTLSSYPLNLRIACQELIAEQAIEPDKMSKLISMLVNGTSVFETAEFAGRLLDRKIGVHKDFEKKTGEELEAEQASFAYIFVHNFLPVLKLFLLIGTLVFSVSYLCWQFIYKPISADRIYKMGIERIGAGQYSRANERFWEAFAIHEKQSWFFQYARAFRDARQFTLAEEKYLELFTYSASRSRRGIPHKAAVLEYADLLANYMGNYELADWVIRRNILDHVPLDFDAHLAVGDINLMWGEYDPSRLEYARQAYAIVIENIGSTDPLLERMLKYFIRVDNLEQVLLLQVHFMEDGRSISAATLTEMGGYYLDKRFEVVRGVPDEFLWNIEGIREILIKSLQTDPMLPETYYHLARYYQSLGNYFDERSTLEIALRAFDHVREESPNRIRYHILSLRRSAELLVERREFFPAEEHLVKGINLYQDGLSRRILARSPELGRLFADMGDLELFTKDGNMQNVLDYYILSELHGWAPPEVQFRMGAAYYQLRQWAPALERFTAAHREVPLNHRVLYALGNVSYMRGNYFAAQGYFDRLLETLASGRERFPVITPTDDRRQLEIAERIMVAQNNLGVTLEALTERTGNTAYRTRAQSHFADSVQAWDVVTRNPMTMFRMRPSIDINAPGVNPAFLNIQNSLNPSAGFEHHFFLRVDNDIFDESRWEELAPPGFSLSEGIHTGR